jgi:hypothetical protein
MCASLPSWGWVLTERQVIDRFVGRTHEFMVAAIEAHLGRSLAPDWEDEFRRPCVR